MHAFTYHGPKSVDEAKAAFDGGGDASYIAGGHTLIPAMKTRLAAPSDLVDLTRIAALKGIALDGDMLRIGAGETHAAVAASAVVLGAIPALAALAGSIGDPQVRHRGTLGGSVANNDPAADYPAALLALEAVVETSEREVAADDFFDGLYATVLEPGEIVMAVRFRVPESAGYAKFRSLASRYPTAGAMVARRGAAVRVAITGAGADGVFRWAGAEDALSAAFEAAALEGLALDPSDMAEDLEAGADYRAHLARVCVLRALAGPGTVTYL